MRVVIVSDPPDLSAYVGEILKTWGLACFDRVGPDAPARFDPAETPVAVVPATDRDAERATALVEYALRGGTVVCCLPQGELAAAVGLDDQGDKSTPLQLRVTAFPAAGLAGELLPVVGRARSYACAPDAGALAYLSHPRQYRGESVGIVRRSVGRGRIVAFAFDLPLCVLMERQGDPARAESIPPDDACARPSHMAVDTGMTDGGWVPHADLLGRLLVDVVRRHVPAPVPLVGHLPGDAAAILLYSGDEDGADVAWNDEELDYVAAAGARMNLYIIPIGTKSTPDDVRRYAARHDVGPHPNLRPLDGHSKSDRLAEYERQIRMFQDMFGIRARTLRNHSTVWPGYLEPAEVQARFGLRMDANFCSSGYKRDRQPSPYAHFGAAMPMRFCWPDGRLIDVMQQHTHLSDDVMFSQSEYSYRYSPEQFEVLVDRVFDDMTRRFHTPFAVCIHPSNWVKFSRRQGQALLRQAGERDMPVWSFDQWSMFQDARDTWRIQRMQWAEGELSFTAEGDVPHDDLALWLPGEHEGSAIRELAGEGTAVTWHTATRYRQAIALVRLPAGSRSVCVRARYG